MEITPDICATIGFFDGVHRGHRFLLEQLQEIAREKQQKSAVITFRNHPRTCLKTDYIPELLTTTEEKLDLIDQAGIDYCFLMDFSSETAQMTAREFIQNFLSEKLNIKTLLIGYDHRFGKDRSEDFDDYVRFGEACGMEVVRTNEYQSDDVSISSTVIRNKIQHKEIAEANKLLGHPYSLAGKVIRGDQLGQKIGFPTANLEIPEAGKIIPPPGIYAVWVILDGKKLPGMAYIGNRPTVSNQKEKRIEVHLIDFSSDLYGKTLRMEFVQYLRDDQTFDSIKQLQEQLTKDKKSTLAQLSSPHF